MRKLCQAECYRILGLRLGASDSEICCAYRQLAKQYHPDVNPDNEEAEKKFIQVQAAFERLTGGRYVVRNVSGIDVHLKHQARIQRPSRRRILVHVAAIACLTVAWLIMLGTFLCFRMTYDPPPPSNDLSPMDYMILAYCGGTAVYLLLACAVCYSLVRQWF